MEIVQLQQVNNKFTSIVDLWPDIIVVGFIKEFVVDTTKYYNATEKEFQRGPQDRYIKSLYTSIKILLYNKVVMPMVLDI